MSTATTTIAIHSQAFKEGQKIPRKYSAEGQNLSPPLKWSNPPAATRQQVLIVDDPDAPRGIFTHWVAYNLPPDLTSLPEGVPIVSLPDELKGGMQGRNSADKIGYMGPLPPPGHGIHHYRFHVYALDQAMNFKAGLTREDVLAQIEGHVIGEGQLVGLYERK